jgi:serine protease
MKRHRPGMICLIVALTLVFSMCRQKEQAGTDTTDTSTTAATGTTMTVPEPEPVQKIEATPEAVAKAQKDAEEFAERDRKMHAILTFEEYIGTVYKEPFEGGKWIVNGDTAFADVKQLEEFYEKNVKPKPPKPEMNAAFAMNVIGGLDDKWNSIQQRQLTYCVSTTFGGRQPNVVAQMEAATAEWEKYGNLDFIHVAAQDSNCDGSNAAVVFDVRPVNANGKYLARAFFPNEPRLSRNVLIDETSFELDPSETLQLVGILRHELGHTIGARHEHTRPEAGTCFEDADWHPLTSYDAFSVMHYPQCNGLGDWSLVLTPKDKSGVACVYGPASGFTMDPTLVNNSAKCAAAQPIAPAPGQPMTETVAEQTVAKGKTIPYGPYAAKPGTLMEARIGGAGASGDPDLYVRFAGQPTVSSYDCRPYTSGANEVCALTVPATATQFFVMVRGYAAGKYDLTVTHTP